MSGGPYGRGKAPERACLNVEDWPEPDRRLWRAALTGGDIFEDGGERAGHRAITNLKAEKGYGRWLTFLAIRQEIHANEAPRSRITPDRVKAFVAELDRLGNANRSVLARLQELKEVAQVLDPARDWRFISAMASKVRARRAPPKEKRSRMVEADELLDLGLRLMDEAHRQPTARLQAIDFRDGLIIAFLSLRPLRRRNLAGLRLGVEMVRLGDQWRLAIAPENTKTGVSIEGPWPAVLGPYLATYLRLHRPVLETLQNRWTKPVGDALWVSSHASPMTEMALYQAIAKRTADAFGRSINPHLFRDCAATTLAVHDPQHVRLAAPLLGHASLATTEKHYQQAQSLTAHREYVEVVQKRKRSS